MDIKQKVELKVHTCCMCHGQFDAAVLVCPVDGIELAPDPLVGSLLLERYQISSMIGSGGWGTVYKANQEGLNRTVAIKVLHRHLAFNHEKVKRFELEAQSLTLIKQKNVASIFDFGVLPTGQPFYVMDYLEGVGLDELISKKGPLPVSEAVDIFIQLCDGLGSAHEAGIIHRDIKPSNVFIGKDKDGKNLVQVLDFGLAKLKSNDADVSNVNLTVTGETVGTPRYMSPEQCRSQALDARSDIYSLGCVMYEALLGVWAIDGQTTYECMSNHISSMPQTFAEAIARKPAGGAKIPISLETIVFKAFEKDPKDRYQTVKQLREDLKDVADALEKAPQSGVGAGFANWLQNFFRTTLYTIKRVSGLGRRQSFDVSLETAGVLCVFIAVLAALGWLLAVEFGVLPGSRHQNVSEPKVLSQLEKYHQIMSTAQTAMNTGDYNKALNAFADAETFATKFNTNHNLKVCLFNEEVLFHILNRPGDEARVRQQRKDITAAIKSEAHPVDKFDPTEGEMLRELVHKLDKNSLSNADRKELTFLANRVSNLAASTGPVHNESLLKETLKVVRAALGGKSREYLNCLSTIALAEFLRGDFSGARKDLQSCLNLYEALGLKNTVEYRTALSQLGSCQHRLGDLIGAESTLKQALSLMLNAPESSLELKANVADELALVYQREGKFRESLQALQVEIEQVDKRDSFLGQGMRATNRLARLGFFLGRNDEMEKYFQIHLNNLKEANGNWNLGVALHANALAGLYMLERRYDKAESMAKYALEIRQQLEAPSSNVVYENLDTLASVYVAVGKWNKALPLYVEMRAIAEKTAGTDPARLPRSYTKLAYCQLASRTPTPATAKIMSGLPLMVSQSQQWEDFSPMFAQGFYVEPAMKFLSARDCATMEPRMLFAVHQAEAEWGNSAPVTVRKLTDLACFYYACGRLQDSERVAEDGLKRSSSIPYMDPWDTGDLLSCYIAVLRSSGKESQAVEYAKRLSKCPTFLQYPVRKP